jgi:hypothetical protein
MTDRARPQNGKAARHVDDSIEELLTGGNPRTLQNAEVIDLVLATPDRIEELFDCVFSEDPIVRLRGSDALEKVCRRRPDLLQPLVERLLVDVAAVRQASVQWHLAQILSELDLNDEQRRRAAHLLHHNLATFDDWIVTNLTVEALAGFAREDHTLQSDVIAVLHRYADSRHRSVASRVEKLLAEFTG